MKKEVRVGDRVYKLKRLDPFLSPYSRYIGELIVKTPKNMEEAKQLDKELKEAMEEIARIIFVEMPPVEDLWAAIDAAFGLLLEAFARGRELGSFPIQNRRRKSSRTSRSRTKRETNKDTGSGSVPYVS